MKKRFSPFQLAIVTDRASPFVAVCDKPRQGGNSVAEACIFSGPKGNSFDFRAAQSISADGASTAYPVATTPITNTGNGASSYEEWVSTYGDYHGVATVTAKAVAGSKTNEDAYLRQLNEIMETEITAFVEVAARKLLGPVGGNLGQVTNIATGAVPGAYTLSKPSDAYNFATGMVIMFAADASAGVATVRGTTLPAIAYVHASFPDGDGVTAGAHLYVAASVFTGTVAPTAAQSGTGGTVTPANNDFIFRLGDVAQGVDLSDSAIRSFQSWITLSPATGTLFNVNRGQDSRFSGFRVNTTQIAGFSILDRIQLLATIGAAHSSARNARLCVLGPKTWQQLATEAQSYGQLEFTSETKIGIQMITLMTVNGPTKIMMDPHCVESDIWLFTRESLKLFNMDGFPALDTGDGNEILRQAGAAGYEARWHAFSCPTVSGKPWWNGRCDSGNVA